MRLVRTLFLAAALAAPGMAAQTPDPKSPEVVVAAATSLLQAKDMVAAFAALPKDLQDAMAAEYAANQKTLVDPKKDRQFDDFLARMLADGAVEQIVADAKPGLEEYDPTQVTMQLQMGGGMLGMMLQKPAPGQKKPDPVLAAYGQAIQGLSAAAAAWIPEADLASEEKLRTAAGHVVAAVKALKITTAAELRALPLNDLLGRLGPAVGELKAAATAYGVDADAFLASLKVTSVDKGADKALTIAFTAFDTPVSLPLDLERNPAGGWTIAKPFAAKFAAVFGGGMGGGMGSGPGDGDGADGMAPMAP
jgi:hypothetical protein